MRDDWGQQLALEVLSRLDPASATWLAPGRGELTRLAFIAGGVDFADSRHSFDAWPALKGDPELVLAKMFSSMPYIKHCDAMHAQSKAMAVYAASLGISKEGRLGETMEERSANKATELVALSSLHTETVRANDLGRWNCVTGEMWKNKSPFRLAVNMASV